MNLNPFQGWRISYPEIPYPSDYVTPLSEAMSNYDPFSFLSISSQLQFTELVKFGALAGFLMILIHIVVINMLVFRKFTGSGMSLHFGAFHTVVYAPVLEELIFRLGGITAVYYFTGSMPLAILFTALAFALAHLFFYGPYKVVTTFVQGILLGIVFLMGGFVAAVAAHMTNNLLAVMGA